MSDLPALSFVQAPPAPTTFNLLLFGPPGSGKSTAAASAPGNKLWLNAEGPGALAYARRIATERGTQIHEVAVGVKVGPIKETLQAAVVHVREGREPKIDTIVVDTLGKVRDGLAKQIGGNQPTIQQWGQVGDLVNDFVVALRDLPVNVVFLAHEDIKDDEDAGRIVEPMIGGKAQRTVPGEVDIVAYCSVLAGDKDSPARYVGQLVAAKGRRAKDRSGSLGAFRDLDLTEWHETYCSALTPDDSDLPFDVEPPADEEPAGEPEQQEVKAA